MTKSELQTIATEAVKIARKATGHEFDTEAVGLIAAAIVTEALRPSLLMNVVHRALVLNE